MARYLQLSVHNKLLLYKQILKLIWTYGIQLWGCTKPSNLKRIQTFQNKVLRNIVNVPRYIRNDDLHRDLGVETVAAEIKRFVRKHKERLQDHPNNESLRLLDQKRITRRLKRTKPLELAQLQEK